MKDISSDGDFPGNPRSWDRWTDLSAECRPDSVKPSPEQPVGGEEPRPPRALPTQDGHLVSQSNEFQFQRRAASQPQREQRTDSGQNSDNGRDGMAVVQYTCSAVSTFEQAQPCSHGYTGSSDRPEVALAEWACGETYRFDPPGMPRSRCCLRRGPPAPHPCGLRRLLQRTPTPFVHGQRFTVPSVGPASRSARCSADPWWTSPSIWPDRT